MRHLIDSNVAIYWRDGDAEIIGRIAQFDALPDISVLTRVELEGGMYASPKLLPTRQVRWNKLVGSLQVLDIDESVVDAYARIVAVRGFSRRRIIDRLIAATAIAHDLTLVTINGGDLRDIPGLSLEVWPAPAQ